MTMSNPAAIDAIDSGFVARVDPDGKLNLSACLQCGKCSSGCAMRQETDILPHQINRMAALGMERQLLESDAIWMCISCQTCVSRCPMKVDTPALIDALRAEAKAAPEDLERVRVFNETMLGSMRRFGRVYEAGLMGVFKLRTRDFFSDLKKLPMMLRKGKMAILPPRTRGRKAARRVFERVSLGGRRSQ